jgi:hypothetical protein
MLVNTRQERKTLRARRSGLAVLLALLLLLPGKAFAQADAFGDPSSHSAGGGAAGDLVPTTPTIDGGSISVGATAQVVVLFRNDSGQPILSGPIQLYPGSTTSAAVSLNQCAQEPLPPGGVCAVSVSVKGLSPGDWRVEMVMRHSGRARLVTATISGKVEESQNQKDSFTSDVEAIPSELKFGQVTSGQPVVRAVVLRNTTSVPLDIHSIYIEAAEQSGFSLKTDCEKLAPGQACIVTVTWSAVQSGDASGVLLVEHNGPTAVANIPLSGTFTPAATDKADIFPKAVPGKGLLVASQDAIDFGTGIQTTSAITVTLVNVGDAPVKLRDMKLAGGDNGLSISKSGCQTGMVLEPVDACPMTLSWSPVREGSIIDDVQIFHDGARGVLVLPVKGSASAIISQDSKAVRLSGGESIATTVMANGSETPESSGKRKSARSNIVQQQNDSSIDPASVLDGFVVTSHAPDRAIITGPGGSRIIFDGQQVVVGGFLWTANITGSGVELRNGSDKVLLLFDRSLSSVNRSAGQSGGSSGTNSSGTSTAPATSSTAPSIASTATPAAATAKK